jgi:hypothetical protein
MTNDEKSTKNSTNQVFVKFNACKLLNGVFSEFYANIKWHDIIFKYYINIKIKKKL